MILPSQIETRNQHILIYKRNTLHEVQRIFNAYFPFLKLEFFYPQHNEDAIKEKYKTLSEYRCEQTSSILELDPYMLADQVKDYFASTYGLPVEIYRKSKRKWLKAEENWTLEEHNLVGKWSDSPLEHYSMMLCPA